MAQTGNDLNQGLQSFAKYDSTDIDSVNLTNAALSVHIPVWSYPQLGGSLHLGLSIYYNAPTLSLNTGDDGQSWVATGVHQRSADVMWNGSAVANHKDITSGPPHYTYQYSIVTVSDPDGAQHKMGAIPTNGGNGNLTQKLYATDGSGYFIDSTNPSAMILYDSHGNKYAQSGSSSTATDTNSNQIKFNAGGTITDTIGRPLPALPTPVGCNTLQLPGWDGGQVSITLCYSSGLLSSVELPNGTSYQFTYETYSVDGNNFPCAVCTELKQITLPTGGTISYVWETHESGNIAIRTLHSRTLNDGTGNRTWTYVWSGSSPRTITVTDPLGDVSVHTATAFGSVQGLWEETELDQKDNHNTLLKSTTTAYTGTAPSAVLPSSITTTWPTQPTTVRKETRQYGAQFTWQADACLQLPCFADLTQSTGYLIGNPTTVTETDYGSGGAGGTLKTTTTAYEAFPGNGFPGNACASGNSYCTSNLLNLKQSETVTGPGNTAVTNYTYDTGTKGNLLSVSRLKSGSSYVTTDSMTYYSNGMLKTKKDALLHTTQYFYDSTGMFLSSVQDALGHTTQYSYDKNTGVLNNTVDENSQQTSYTYDSMNRILSVYYPDCGLTTYGYDDTPLSASVMVTEALMGCPSVQNKVQTVLVDGFGRTTQTQLNSDPEGVDYTDITYDGLGRKATASNPHRSTSSSTDGTTTYSYDALNRPIQTTEQDGSVVHYVYSGNITTITDEAGLVKQEKTDGLGRLIYVLEDPTTLKLETDYTYDSLGNLTQSVEKGGVASGWRYRTFTYDSLSRLLTANNPEYNTAANNNNGTIHYGYDDDGTLTSKTDGRGITINYTPDVLHRIVQKSYQNDPYPQDQTDYYCYDNIQTNCGSEPVNYGIGKRTGMKDGSGVTAWSYDPRGWLEWENKTVLGYNHSIVYRHNLDGTYNNVTYPDGTIAYYQYSAAGRALQVTDQATNNWALGALYTPAGELTSLTMGSKAGFSGIALVDQYNPRLQPATLSASTPSGQVFGLSYYYGWGASNNGDVQIINNTVDATRSVEYTYDAVNRISQGFSYTTYAWGNIYVYDGWGNLLQKTNMPTKTLGESWNIGVDNNNHLAGYSYDGAGNLTNVNGFSGTVYNAENQWIQQTHFGINYTYDGIGRRVEATGGSSGTRVYWYDESGNVLSESDQNGVFQNDYIFFNGQKITWVDLGHGQPTTNNYYLTDHLGNNRMIITQFGTVCYDADFYPWGVEQYVKTNTCPVQNYKFAGKERDPDMGEDYFGARFYKGDMSRFFSPDWSSGPEPVPYAKLDNPQTLNLYSYVGNNPTTLRDPDGHDFAGLAGVRLDASMTSAVDVIDAQIKAAILASKSQNQPEDQGQQQSGTVPVIVGQRPIHNLLLRILSLGLAKHSYYIVEGDMVQVLGNPGSSHNQQVRINDSRNDRGKEHTIYVSQAQADALDNGANLFAQHAGSGLNQSDYAHPCPTCSGGQEGYNFLLHNSNSFVYNMLSKDPAGSIPPGSAPAFTPGWAMKPDDWYPNP